MPSWILQSASAVNVTALDGFSTLGVTAPVTRSLAGFGQGSWHATPQLTLTVGLRYTHERKTGRFVQTTGGPVPSGFTAAQLTQIQALRNNFGAIDYRARRSDDSLGASVSVAYRPAPEAMIYATYSRGSQSGGLNLVALPNGVDPEVAPQKIDNYEIGLKSQPFGRALTFNLAAFWTEVRDYQGAVTATDTSFGFRQYIASVDKVRSRGVEADIRGQIGRLALSASGAYVDATYRSYRDAPCPPEAPNLPTRTCDLSDRPLAGSSRYSTSLSADYSQPLGGALEAYGRADYSYKSGYFTSVSNSRFSRVPGYGLANLRFGVRTDDKGWDMSIWARNLFDKDYVTVLSPTDTGLVTGIVGDPRTWGGTLRATF